MRRHLASITRRLAFVICAITSLLAGPSARGQASTYLNYESAQTRPICLSPDGTRLFAVNTPDGRLSVFDVSNAANAVPVLIREIAVGIEPVSVNARTNDEAWVVNEVSDSVSIVSVSTGAVVATLACPDEPGDVVFANGRAFVSCSRNNTVRVFDVATRAELATIPLEGLHPRSLAVSADGARVYAAFKLSGNGTTLLPPNLAPAQPPPTNGALPPPPQVGLIVAANDARLNPAPNLPDNDVAEIDTATLGVMRYFKSTGTVNFAVAVRPASTEVWVANTEARNLVRFEPMLNGHGVDNRVTRVDTSAGMGVVTPFDLNAGIDYNPLPNPTAQATALAQPTALVFTPDGAALWVASFGTDRVARVDAATGAVLARIETGPTTGTAADPRNKRGPRGLALHAAHERLYILNRLANTISVVSTASESVVAEIPAGSFDPTPAVIRQGRGFHYDARLSGNGTQSCASCHIDGDRDDIAWDLGEPGGSMQGVSTPFGFFNMHPMKGPMTTQTLRGIVGTTPLHWRGDRANFQAFNPAFTSLLGGAQLSTADMNAYAAFINTIAFEPNPNQNLDRTMPAFFPPGDANGGNPNEGRRIFLNDDYQPNLRCNTCHAVPLGTNRVIISASALQESQDFKIPHLRNVYQKLHFVGGAPAVSLSGFGIVHDGMDPDILTFLSRPVFGTFANDTTRQRHLNAFLQCFDTGTAPSVGWARTVTAATVASASANWTVLEAQARQQTGPPAAPPNCDLVVKLVDANGRRGFVYRPATNDYLPDRAALAPMTRAALEAMIVGGATATIMGAPRTSGQRLGVDRDEDTILDGDERMPAPTIAAAAGTPQLTWPLSDGALVLEFTDSLTAPDWQPVTEPRTASGATIQVLAPTAAPQRFYRLRQP